MKIVITGAQSTGKTTLLQALSTHPYFADAIVRNETTRNVLRGSLGVEKMEINERGTDDVQKLILAQHIANSVAPPDKDVIYDRGAIDGFVYTQYLYEKNQVSREVLYMAYSVFINTKYDIIFYLRPEFPIVSDGERSINTEFRDRIVELFDEYLPTCKTKVVNITGTVEERVNQIVSAVQQLKKE